jgi:hypothetical protein
MTITPANIDQLAALIEKAINPSVAEEARKAAALTACELVHKMGIVNAANINSLKQALPLLNMMLAKKK